MKKYNLLDMKRGWFIGNFEPCVLKTENFEIGVLTHKKDEEWPRHFHKEAIEYNCLLEGKMLINDTLIEPNTIFVIEQNEIIKPKFLEDCKLVVIKTPSVIGDKYEV